MHIRQLIITNLVLGCLTSCWVFGCRADSGAEAREGHAKSRHFRLTYGATLKRLPPGRTVRVWLPLPAEILR